MKNKEHSKQTQHKIIAIGNPKGGVGKTATTVSIARIIKDNPSFKGKRILLIDTDPLGILTKMIVGRREKIRDNQTLLPVLTKGEALSQIIQPNAWPALDTGVTIDYVCANRTVSKLESSERFDLFRLKNSIEEIRDRYFKIMIDCPANSNNLYFSSCIAADRIIFPFGSIESLSGLEVTCLELCQIDEHLIDNITILFTMQDVDSELTASLINTARNYLDFKQFETIIRRCPRFSLEIADSQTTGTYAVPDSIAINDYLFLVEELFAGDFGKTFTNRQRFHFLQGRIDERLWAAFYETSFLITNEREKARLRKPRGAMEDLQQFERQLKTSPPEQKKAKEAGKSRKVLVETCLKTCQAEGKILGNQDLFYIAELLPGDYRQLKNQGKPRNIYLLHADCFELMFARLLLQQDTWDANRMGLIDILSITRTDVDNRYCSLLRKRLQNSFLTFIRDPQEKIGGLTYLVHMWDIYREREYIGRLDIRKFGRDLTALGVLSTELVQGRTLIVSAMIDPERSITRQNLSNDVTYRNLQDFKSFLEERLKALASRMS